MQCHLHKHCFRDHCLFLKKPKGLRDILKQIVQKTKFKVWYRKVDLSVATCKYDFNLYCLAIQFKTVFQSKHYFFKYVVKLRCLFSGMIKWHQFISYVHFALLVLSFQSDLLTISFHMLQSACSYPSLWFACDYLLLVRAVTIAIPPNRVTCTVLLLELNTFPLLLKSKN